MINDILGLIFLGLGNLGMKPAAALTLVEFMLVATLVGLVYGAILATRVYARSRVDAEHMWMVKAATSIAMPAGSALACWAVGFLLPEGMPGHLLKGTALLMMCWLVARTLRILPGPKPLKTAIGVGTCLVLLMFSIGSLRPIFGMIERTQVTLGGLTIALQPLLEGMFFLVILGWLAVAGTSALEYMLERNSNFSPTLQTVLAKVFKFAAIFLCMMVTLSVFGVNVTHLAVFGGALAIGLGWSLRPITSNLISGLFLLMDHSIKPGDVISLDDHTFGQVKALHSRYVVLRRRDGKEVLIPNEMLMNQPVINWSYTNKAVRSEVDIPVPHDCDMEQVQEILKGAVNGVPRVQSVPAPIVFIKEFGEYGAIFIVRFWSVDPEMGVNNLKGDVNMACWKALKQKGIDIPLPQRVLHMTEAPEKSKVRKAK